MITTVQKWGNGQGIHIPRQILDKSQFQIGDNIEIYAEKGVVILKSAELSNYRKYRLEDLLAKIPENYSPKEIDWGKPEGEEVW